MTAPTQTGDKPHYLRRMKDLAARLTSTEKPKKDWHAERVRIGRIAMADHVRRMERVTP